jgi:hypothetical protein
MLQERVPLI